MNSSASPPIKPLKQGLRSTETITEFNQFDKIEATGAKSLGILPATLEFGRSAHFNDSGEYSVREFFYVPKSSARSLFSIWADRWDAFSPFEVRIDVPD